MSNEELRQYIATEAEALGIVPGERKDPVD